MEGIHYKKVNKFYTSLLLIALLLLSSAQIVAPYSSPQVDENIRLGGGPVALQSYDYNPRLYFNTVLQRVDKNNNGIADELEAKLSNIDEEEIDVNIVFGGVPAAFGTDAMTIKGNLAAAAKIVEAYGGKIKYGPWTHALIGFSATIPASSIYEIASRLQGLDIDSDGLVDPVLISEDKEVHAFNYWSSRQMNIRPYVWETLGINGSGVTVAVLDTGIDGNNSAFPPDKIVWWADYTGDANGNKRDTPYDDNLHGSHVAGTVAGLLSGLDDQGRVVITFGVSDLDLSGYDGSWLRFGAPYMAYFVNATGTIEFQFMWKSDTTATNTRGSISAVGIAYCGWVPYTLCTPTLVANVSTPNENTWYTVTYDVTSESQYGFYILMFQVGTGGGLAMLPVMKFPVSAPDGSSVPYLAGMAPGAKLGGGKVLTYAGSGSTSGIATAIDDAVGNRTSVNPPIYIISMSLGGSYDSTIDTAVTNAVNAGVLVVVAAGNDGPGSGTAASGSPASNPLALTIAAIDAFNNITDYSSDGGNISSGCSQIKPDVAAPGGGNTLMIYSADTSYHDDLLNSVSIAWFTQPDIDWDDVINVDTAGYDDSLGISGTSMATPHVSGLGALVVSALVNSAGYSWDWTSSASALFVKNIIEISTFETYPLLREENTSEWSPTLDKGGKDIHEGYGAVDAAAAVDLALSMGPGKAVLPGTIMDLVFRNGTLVGANFRDGVWEYPWGRSVYAYRVHIPVDTFKDANGTTYDVVYVFRLASGLSDKSNVDLDLYLYSMQGDSCGDPVILARSVQGFGYDELITYNPSGSGDYIIAAKRAREDSVGGVAYLIVGPWADVTGIWNNTADDTVVYIGGDLEIRGISAYGAPTAEIKIIDNTTGDLLDTLTVTTSADVGGSTSFSTTWTVPNDPTLDGHTLLVVVSYLDSSGQVVEGPTYDAITVSGTPPPIPEPWYLGAVVIAIITAYLLYSSRRSAAN